MCSKFTIVLIWCIFTIVISYARLPNSRLRAIAIYKLCPEVQCNGSTTETRNSRVSNCKCDSQCKYFGDCCADAPAVKTLNSSAGEYLHTPGRCIPFPSEQSTTNIYMKNFCNESAIANGMTYSRARCLDSNNHAEQVNWLMMKIPVTDMATGISYGNIFCAACSDIAKEIGYSYWNLRPEVRNLTFWNVRARCETMNQTYKPVLTRYESNLLRWSLKNYTFNSTFDSWQTNVNNRTENCTLTPELPSNTTGSVKVRECDAKYANVVSNCTLTNHTEAGKCPGFRALVRSPQGKIYRNVYCALCNGEEADTSNCAGLPVRFLRLPMPEIPPATDDEIIDANSSTTNRTSVISTNATTNRTTKTSAASMLTTSTTTITTSVITTTASMTTSTTSIPLTTPQIPIGSRKTKRVYMYITTNSGSTTLNIMNFTKVTAETVYYTTTNRTFVRNKNTVAGSRVEVCDVTPTTTFELSLSLLIDAFKSYAKIELASYFILVTSNVLLLIHLYEFRSPKAAPRTTNQKMLASYALAMFAANVGFLLNEYSADFYWTTPRYCRFSYALEYYGCLAMYFWSTFMAFEIMCNVLDLRRDLDVEPKNARFKKYSMLSWIGAGLITGVRIWQRGNPDVAWYCSFRYEFDQLRFLIFPFIASLSMMSTFYVCSLYVIRTREHISSKLSKLRGIDLNLHTNLTIFSTLMWLALNMEARIGTWTLVIPAWIFFKVLNCLLSLIIFMHSPVQNVLSQRLSNYVKRYSMWLIFEE